MQDKTQEILTSANFPADILLLDFETYFDEKYSLSKMSTVEYVTDERFECLGFGAWESDYGTTYWYDKPHVQGRLNYYKGKYGENFENCTLAVQNAFFDPLILAYHFNIKPKYILDIKHLAAHIEARASHKLKDMAKQYSLSNEKGDTLQFKGLHWKDIQGEPKYELPLMDYTLNDITLEKELLLQMLSQISRSEIELQIMNHTHGMYLYPSLRLNMSKARSLIPRMKIKMKKELKDYDPEIISGTISFTKALIEAMPKGEKIPLKPGKPTKNMIPLTGLGKIPATAKSDAEIDRLKFHDKKEVRDLIHARLALKSWPTHIKKLQGVIRQARARDGWLGIPLHYYGGHTGRFSGAEKINVHNFAERVDPLMGEIKTCIEAPDGYSLLLLDLSQVECRYVSYLAGQSDILDCFASGGDIYSEFATRIFKEEVRKPTKDDPEELYNKLYLRRYIGKQAVLGLGYGMGAERFFNQIQEYEVVRKLVKQRKIEFKFAEDVVKLYRKTYKKIPDLWGGVEKNFKWVIKYPHDKKEMDCGIKFWKEGKMIRVQLPSGRIQNYQQSSYRNGELRWKYGSLWGGTLVENITQAACRDIFVEGLLGCLGAGLNPVMHVHDSIVICVQEDDAQEKLEVAHNIMTTTPNWCSGLPLDTDRKISKNYQ